MKRQPNTDDSTPPTKARQVLLTILPTVCLAMLATSCSTPGASAPPARPTVSIQWRETFRVTENHALPVGGLSGRTIGVMEQKGLVFHGREEVATLASWLTYESTGTNISCRGYSQFTFEDGATIVALVEGKGAAPGKQRGTLTFLRGTGRFLGIDGRADYAGVAVTAPGAGGDMYVDVAGTYSLLQSVPPPR